VQWTAGGKGAEETYVLVLSKKPQDAINGFITIEPFTGDPATHDPPCLSFHDLPSVGARDSLSD
jgi:hypothetical protein